MFLNPELHPKKAPVDPNNPEPDRYFDPAADIVEYLLSKGADPNARTLAGATALSLAAAANHSDIVRVLQTRGARLAN